MKKRCLIMNLVMIILSTAFVSMAHADPLSNWSLRYTSSVELNAVTFGKGMFVAVGCSGTIVTSPDGKAWTVRNSGTTEDLAGIVFGNNKFVAVGFNLILTSLDGVTWTSKQTQGFGANPSIAYGNGLFVVASYTGEIFTSSDGLNWTLIQTTPCYLKTPSYGNGKFVIPGTRGYGTGTYVYVSSNGLNWSEYNVVTGYQANDSAFGNGLFVIVGQKYDAPHNGVILRSADGFHWTELDTEVIGFGGIAYGDLGFLVPAGEGFLVSSDAVSWSLMQGGWPFGNATTFANSTYVTVGNTIYQSDPVSSTNNCTTTVSNDQPISIPTTQEVTELIGDEIANAPVYLGDIATGGNQMQFTLSFPSYMGPVDEYIAIQLPNGTLFFFGPNGFTTNVVAYNIGVTSAQRKTIYNPFDVYKNGQPLLSAGKWVVYSLVCPSNGGDLIGAITNDFPYDLLYYTFAIHP